MPTTPTYSPVPHAPATAGTQSAPAWRYAQYAEPHPVQPLKGLPGTRATDVSYRALAPGGAGFCYRICTGTSESRPTAHYSLLTANSTYTFSAKEKDSETGLSYFGSRYYSSDLSVWLSVDPMSDKYPSLSPYVYCADNPVKLVDPNGEEINPIFSTSGELLGTDSKGWKGTAIVMDKKDFKKGMKHEDALKKGTELDKYGKGIKISDKDWKTVEEKGGERMSPYVKNHSGETIYFKPETTYGEYKNDGAYPLGAGKDLYMPVDGIAVPHLKKNQVYKITDNTRVSVSNTSISYQAVNRIIMGARGGWKGNFWHGFRTTDFSIVGDIRYPIRPADHSWDALFATSKR